MSQHGCPERLSNRSKTFQDDGPSQQTMEVLVETLTGTAFEMTVSPTDTIFAIKSKIFRVEGIPVSQQHLLYNLKELDDASSLREHSISDGARLRLVLGMRGGPISTRRLPPPPNSEPWRDIERLLESNRDRGSDGAEAGGSGCKVTVLVFTDGERATMLRVRENTDGTYSPVDHPKYTEYSSLSQYLEGEAEGGGGGGVTGVTSTSGAMGAMGATGVTGVTGTRRDNALTLGKMLELRRRMETLSLNRAKDQALHEDCDSVEIQKTRSEESLPVSEELEEEEEEEEALAPHYDGRYTRYDYDCSFADRYTLLPPIGRSDSSQSVVPVEERSVGGSLEEEGVVGGAGGVGGVVVARTFGSSSQLSSFAPAPRPHSLFSSSTSDLESLKRNRLLPALSRHRNREHLHLSDDHLHLRDAPAQAPTPTPTHAHASQPHDKAKKVRIRCGFCKKRLSIATVHRCRCGAEFCAPHRYAEVHGCAYDYKAAAHGLLRRANPLVSAPKLPKI